MLEMFFCFVQAIDHNRTNVARHGHDNKAAP